MTTENQTREDRYVREPEVERITGLERTTIWRMEKRGEFPARRKITGRAVGWLLSEIETWMSNRSAA